MEVTDILWSFTT